MENKMKKTAKKHKGVKTLVTVRELKTWLDGYCSAHGDGWSPTSDQWEMIRDKIFSLQEGDELVEKPVYHTPYLVAPLQLQGPIPRASTPVAIPPQQILTDSGTMSAPPTGFVGATDRPAIIMKDGKLKTPDKAEAGGPSDFA